MRQEKIVYIVDPDEAIREALTALLGTYAMPVRAFGDAETFLNFAFTPAVSAGCVLIDVNLPDLNGLYLVQRLRVQGFTLPLIVFTNSGDDRIRRQALLSGASEVIEKPLINTLLVERLGKLMLDGSLPGNSETEGRSE